MTDSSKGPPAPWQGEFRDNRKSHLTKSDQEKVEKQRIEFLTAGIETLLQNGHITDHVYYKASRFDDECAEEDKVELDWKKLKRKTKK